MKKPKVIGRYVRMYAYHSSKKMILGLKDVLESKSPVKSYEIKDEDIENAGIALDKIFKIIDSCKYVEHIECTERYIKAYKQKFPFALIIEKILLKKIEKKRVNLNHWEFVEEDEYTK